MHPHKRKRGKRAKKQRRADNCISYRIRRTHRITVNVCMNVDEERKEIYIENANVNWLEQKKRWRIYDFSNRKLIFIT